LDVEARVETDNADTIVARAQQLVSHRLHCTLAFAQAFLRHRSVIERCGLVDVARSVIESGERADTPRASA